MKFIKLTEVQRGQNPVTVLLNVHFIKYVKKGNGGDTLVQLNSANFLFVRETVEDIWDKINFDTTKAPVIMDAEQYRQY